MSKLLIHIHSGPESPNKVSLGLLVAAAAAGKEGVDPTVFLAADGVHLLNLTDHGECVGQGTGDVKNHLDVLRASNTKIYVSRMSANGRGYDESLLDGYNAEFAWPDDLLACTLAADSILCY